MSTPPSASSARSEVREDQLPGHVERALRNGVTREELGELITHLTFCAGWPAAMTAARIAKKVFDERTP